MLSGGRGRVGDALGRDCAGGRLVEGGLEIPEVSLLVCATP